jgi:PilX N-terminal
MRYRYSSISAAARQRGAAALLVVVVLFFILALVTAYTSRNLIFEQRTSANNQRSTQALEVAEAGVEFAVAMLGGGRVDAACLTTNDTAQNTFRQRNLTQDTSGTFVADGAQPNLRPTCMLLSSGTSCSCPSAGAPDLVLPVGLAPTFQVRFETAGLAQPGIVRVVSRGCSSLGSQCYAGVASPADAEAEVSILLGLNSALATPPAAAMTVRGSIDLNGGSIGISNADVPTGGITIDAGGAVVNAANARLSSLPGTPGSASVQASDPSLTALSADRMFVSLFGMDRATYRSQPAAVRVICNGNCAVAIASAVSANPGRIVWVEGNATIDANQVLGSPAAPVIVFVQGDLTVSANLEVHGLLYLHASTGTNNWATNAGTTLINGAVVAEGNLTITGAPNVAFDASVLSTINLTQGSMVRVPGSWRDFAAGS